MLPPKQSETSNSLGHDWTRDRMPEWQKSWVAKEGSIFTIFSVSIDSRAHPSPDAYILIASLIVSLQPGAGTLDSPVCRVGEARRPAGRLNRVKIHITNMLESEISIVL